MIIDYSEVQEVIGQTSKMGSNRQSESKGENKSSHMGPEDITAIYRAPNGVGLSTPSCPVLARTIFPIPRVSSNNV
jgi:hypothetical protein